MLNGIRGSKSKKPAASRGARRRTNCRVRSGLLAPAAVIFLAGAPATLSAADRADLPLREVRLYRSGVGYFEHRGHVDGDVRVRLTFDTERINDVLKSLVVLSDGGGIGAIGYDSKAPLAKRLASFGIDLSDSPTLPDLFKRLRGVQVRLQTQSGQIEGAVLSVEQRSAPMGADESIVSQPTVNLVTSSGIRNIRIGNISTFQILDEQLAGELQEALAALAQARTERMVGVDLSLEGDQRRNVALGYVHEMPVWKMTYRLVLPEESGESPRIQGWAIVENTTDTDWNNVRLSLSAGQPVGFVMDLYEPLFVPRPKVPVPYALAQAPEVYERGAERLRSSALARRESADSAGRSQELAYSPDSKMAAPQAQAGAEEIGESFFFTLDSPITIERQRSAMAPILNEAIEGRRVSIYKPDESHPMRGVELSNETDVQLLPGPISIFDGGAYAGDAQIGHVPTGDDRLLAFATDLDVTARTDRDMQRQMRHVRIVEGVLHQVFRRRVETTYTFENAETERGRTIVVEHPIMDGWGLVSPEKPTESTNSAHRFEVEIDPGAASRLAVAQERTDIERLEVTSMDIDRLLSFAADGKVSQQVVDAVRKAADLKANLDRIEGRLADLGQEREAIFNDQQRIRNNMSRVDSRSELYGRYMRKLAEQETRLEGMHEEKQTLEQSREAARDALNSYLSDLDVD